MNKQKIILSIIFLVSVFDSVVLLLNFQSFITGLTTVGYQTPTIMTVASFLNFVITVLSIINIRTNGYSKLWYIMVIFFSAFGNIIFSGTQLITTYRKERIPNA